ncbi:MAG: response regulator transcription factor [Bacteroidales bacterium]
MIKLLLIEDERTLAGIIRDTLNDNGFSVELAYDGIQGLERYHAMEPDVIVTDIMMPHLVGFTLVEQLRKSGCTTPVLYLSARSTPDDIVQGFETGGNDYLRKPFAISELIVRIKSLLGRCSTQNSVAQEQYLWEIGKYTFDSSRNLLCFNETATLQELAARESEVLLYLCRHQGQIVEHKTILRTLWGDDNFFNGRSLNVYISKLRHKLCADPSLSIINIRGTGYKLMKDI